MYGSERPQDYVAKFERPLQAAARRQHRVLCRARQSRRSEPALLQELRHGRQALLHLSEEGRALLRPRQQLHGPGPAALARGGAFEVQLEVENRLLPSPDLFFRRPARIGSGLALDRRADVHQVQPQRGLCRPRALLRAAQAAEGHPLLHRRRLRETALRRHHQRLAADRQGLRHRTELHARRDRRRRAALPDHFSPRQARRLRRDPARARRHEQDFDRCSQASICRA